MSNETQNNLWLCVDLSSPTGTIALSDGGKPLDEAVISPDFSHSEKLIETLEGLLGKNGLSLRAVERFVTTSGPGSFTGLRIALASLKAFAFALGKPIDTVSASEARALAWLQAHPGQPISVVTYVAKDRFVRADFPGGEEKVVSSAELTTGTAEGTTFLLDDKTPAPPGVKTEKFPLRASQLGIALLKAKSRRTYESLPDLIEASPQYFGETKYRTID